MISEPKLTIHKNGNHLYVLLNGQYHREDGPAFIRPNGYQAWYKNGERHRIDGPARIWGNGNYEWFLDSKQYTFEEFCSVLALTGEDKLILKLKYAG